MKKTNEELKNELKKLRILGMPLLVFMGVLAVIGIIVAILVS